MCPAQQVQQFTPVRYHFGDDARWADPNRDDNLWSVAADGRVPTPAIDTDGFVRSRVRVAVPHNMAGPLAIRWDTGQNGPNVQEVYVNGVRVMIRDRERRDKPAHCRGACVSTPLIRGRSHVR